MRCHFKRTVIIRAGKEVEKVEGSCVADRIKNGSTACKNSLALPQNVTHNLAIPFLGVHP